MAARFPELSEDELSCLLVTTGKKLREYKKATIKTAVSVFRQYLQARKINEDDVIRYFFKK